MNRLYEEDKAKQSGNDNLFNFSLPEYNFLVDLPSKGEYYSEKHPLHKKEFVELKIVTGKEEAILTNKDYIRKGIVLDKFLQALFTDRSLIFTDIYNELLLADKFAMLVAARIQAYSKEYSAEIKCPKCAEKILYEFDLTKTVSEIGYLDIEDKSKIERVKHDCFRFKLPQCNLSISVKLLSTKEETSMMQKSKKLKESDSLSFKDQYIDLIVDIEGNTTREAKEYFLDRAPAIDLFFLRSKTQELNPQMNLQQEFTCPSCYHVEEKMGAPITQNFLFPHLKSAK